MYMGMFLEIFYKKFIRTRKVIAKKIYIPLFLYEFKRVPPYHERIHGGDRSPHSALKVYVICILFQICWILLNKFYLYPPPQPNSRSATAPYLC